MSTIAQPQSPFRNAVSFVAWLVVCFAAAGLGGALTSASLSDWYETLHRPSFAPPNWVFGPVWTVLYAMMAVAAWLVWRQQRPADSPLPLAMFITQLMLNVAWSGIFFALQSPGWAFVEILILWAAILATAILFFPISRLATLLLVPYLLWVSFASVLNGAFWWLNR